MNCWTELEFWQGKTWPKIFNVLQDERLAGNLVLPNKNDMLRALRLTPFDKVKVVIIGQDPYPTKNHANGLAFSVNPETKPLPKSLQNIFKELKSDLGIERTTGDLTDWAEQGVLLLNTSLTVVEGKPGSHSSIGWEILTKEIIHNVSEHKENVVFILWGKHAQRAKKNIECDKHYVIESAHPSPLSAHSGFFGSKCFSKTNQYLKSHSLAPISW